MKKKNALTFGARTDPFENRLFGVNAEITRRGFFGGLSAQMLNNRKLYAGDGAPAGWSCRGADYLRDRLQESPCGSAFVILRGGAMEQTSEEIALRAGETYEAAVWVRALSDAAQITFGVTGCERTFSLSPDGRPFCRLAFCFSCREALHGGTFAVRVRGEAAVFEASLLPADHFCGMRRDVVDALKALAPTSVRFPGGCAADHFDWHQSLKAPDLRTPADGSSKWFLFRDTYNQDCLDIGINEFMALCREIGAEPEFTVSLLLSDGEDARQLVEYCNGAPETEFGARRQALGFDPFGVKLWYIGNEAYFFGNEYRRDGALAAKRTDELIRAMRRADSSITPVVGLTWGVKDRKWSADFAAALESPCTHVSYHNYIGILPDRSQGENCMATPAMLESNFADGRDFGLDFYRDVLFGARFSDVRVCADEWNYAWGRDSSNALLFSNALQFHFFAKSKRRYHIDRAEFFMPLNEGMISVRGRDCRLESSGELFCLLQGHKDGTIVEAAADAPALDLLATEHGGRMYLSVVNRFSETYELSLPGYRIARAVQLEMKEFSFESNDCVRTDDAILRPHGILFLTLEKS